MAKNKTRVSMSDNGGRKDGENNLKSESPPLKTGLDTLYILSSLLQYFRMTDLYL